MEGQVDAEREVVQVEARARSGARRRATAGRSSRGAGPGPAARRARPRRSGACGRAAPPASAARGRAASRAKPTTRSAFACRASRNARTATATAPVAAPPTFSELRQRAFDLRRRGREHEEVEREEDEHRDQVDEPLEDDRGEPGRRRDRVAPRHEPGPQQLSRARDEEARGEPDHGRGEEVGVSHPPERSEEVPPPPRAHGVDADRDEDEPQEGQGAGRRGAPGRGRSSRSHGRTRRAGPRRAGPRGGAALAAPSPALRAHKVFLIKHLIAVGDSTTMPRRASNQPLSAPWTSTSVNPRPCEARSG